MQAYSIIYILVLSYGFSPSVVGFGNNDIFYFESIEEVSHKLYEVREIKKSSMNAKLFKVSLMAEEMFEGNQVIGTFIRTEYKNEIVEIDLPKLVMKG